MSEPRVLLSDENKGFGGAERHVLTLAGGLNSKGLLKGLAARKTSWLAKNMGDLPFYPVGYRNEVDMLSVYSLYRKIKAEGVNVLHCIGHRDLVAAALARNLPGAPPTVLVKAEHSYPDPKLSPLFRWAYGQCQAVASVSESLKQAVKSAVTPSASVEMPVIANGLEIPRSPQPAPELKGREFRIGVLSPLRPGKGHSDFLKACAALNKKRQDLTLVLSIAGGGELQEPLQEEARQLDLSVNFLGHVPDPLEYLSSVDLSVVPSHRETFSLVTLESLACGRPVVAADCDGIAELCRRSEDAVLYPVGDASALAKALEEFCDNASERLRSAWSNSEKIRSEFSLESMTEQYCELYRKLLS